MATRAVLFVPLDRPGSADRAADAYLDDHAFALGALGVAAAVYRVRACDLRNARVLAAFRARGVDSLPAVLTEGHALVGLRAIRGHFSPMLASIYRNGRAGGRTS